MYPPLAALGRERENEFPLASVRAMRSYFLSKLYTMGVPQRGEPDANKGRVLDSQNPINVCSREERKEALCEALGL